MICNHVTSHTLTLHCLQVYLHSLVLAATGTCTLYSTAVFLYSNIMVCGGRHSKKVAEQQNALYVSTL